MINICTYVDYNYIKKILACLKTLEQYDANIFILCFDDKTYQIINNKNIVKITLKEIEDYCPKLLTIKNKRLLKEYYLTISPVLPLYIFDKYNVDLLFYTDADMAFWNDPNEMIDVMGNYSLMVTDHENKNAYTAGFFNVGILGYRNDDNCKEFLYWWGDRCIEWCEWRYAGPGLCGDQAYLNVLKNEPNKFKNTLICPLPGINLGAWNVALHNIEDNNGLKIDGKNLISYHYHGYSDKLLNGTGWDVSEKNKQLLYIPYKNILGGL
jgi:hypothetical protein